MSSVPIEYPLLFFHATQVAPRPLSMWHSPGVHRIENPLPWGASQVALILHLWTWTAALLLYSKLTGGSLCVRERVLDLLS